MMQSTETDRFGHPVRNDHISLALCAALLACVRTYEQWNIAVETIERIQRTPIPEPPPAEPPPAEPSPACKKFYADLARSGSARDVLNVAGLSAYFREHYPAAIAWAEGKKKQIPQDSAIS